jgi:glycogen debranching enzyme
VNNDRAYVIAKSDLLACQSTLGFVAGKHHFVDLWARDSLFATFGADAEISKKTIKTFLRHQRADGLIPYRILRSPTTIGKYFGKPRYYMTPKPDFRSHQSGGLVLDGGLMTVIANSEYVRQTKNTKFLRNNFDQLNRALTWYEKRFGSGLLSEWFQCEWADGILKAGKVLYTNILYCRALFDMGELAKSINRTEDAKHWRVKAETIRQQINNLFWNGSYFSDWYDWRRQDYFSSGSNMLAVVFGVATMKQSQSIVQFARVHCWNHWTLETNYPRYPWWRIPIQNYLVGVADYCNRGGLWLQPGILYAIALYNIENTIEAKKVLKVISEKIIEYNGVYEVYEKNGEPVKRMMYQSEHPFAWSAGLYLWAARLLQ